MTFHPHTAIPINQPHPAKPYEQREYPDNKPLINMKTIRALLSDIIEIIDTLEMLKSKPPVDSNYYVPKPLTPYTGEYCDPGPSTPQVSTYYVPTSMSFTSRDDEIPQQSFGGTGIDLITLARTGAAVGNPDQSFPDDLGVTMMPPASADDAPVWEKARQAVAEAQVNPDYTDAPADDHTITIGFAAQGDPLDGLAQSPIYPQVKAEAEEPAHAGTAETLANALGVPIATVEDGSITHITAPAKTRKPRAPKAPKPDPVDFDAVRVEVAASISSLVEQGKKENIKELLTKFGADRAREISDENIVAFRDELILL